MKIEVLFPELCCLYGDRGNITYLKKCLPKAIFINTHLNDKPTFSKDEVKLIYMGSMSEKSQEQAINKLKPFKSKLRELIENNTIFLLVGNSFEIFGEYIEDENGNKIEALNLLTIYSKRFIPKRFNALFLGSFDNYKIVGYTSRFSHTYGSDTDNYLFKVTKGLGSNEDSQYEGIRINNLFASYMLGPLLIQNPFFTKYLLSLLGETKIAFKSNVMKAYDLRVKELENILK